MRMASTWREMWSIPGQTRLAFFTGRCVRAGSITSLTIPRGPMGPTGTGSMTIASWWGSTTPAVARWRKVSRQLIEGERFMKIARLGGFVLLVALLPVAAAAVKTPKLKFTYTTVTVKGAQSTAIYGINNAGAVEGAYVDKAGVQHGFRMVKGKVKKIDDPNGVSTSCFGINKAGAIVGYYF